MYKDKKERNAYMREYMRKRRSKPEVKSDVLPLIQENGQAMIIEPVLSEVVPEPVVEVKTLVGWEAVHKDGGHLGDWKECPECRFRSNELMNRFSRALESPPEPKLGKVGLRQWG